MEAGVVGGERQGYPPQRSDDSTEQRLGKWVNNQRNAREHLPQERQARLEASPNGHWKTVARSCSFLRVATMTRCGADANLKPADNGLYYCKRHCKEVQGETVRRQRLPEADYVPAAHPTKRKRFSSKQPAAAKAQARPRCKWPWRPRTLRTVPPR